MPPIKSNNGSSTGSNTTKRTIEINFAVAGNGSAKSASYSNISKALKRIFDSKTIQKLTDININISQTSIDRLKRELNELSKIPVTIEAVVKPIGIDMKQVDVSKLQIPVAVTPVAAGAKAPAVAATTTQTPSMPAVSASITDEANKYIESHLKATQKLTPRVKQQIKELSTLYNSERIKAADARQELSNILASENKGPDAGKRIAYLRDEIERATKAYKGYAAEIKALKESESSWMNQPSPVDAVNEKINKIERRLKKLRSDASKYASALNTLGDAGSEENDIIRKSNEEKAAVADILNKLGAKYGSVTGFSAEQDYDTFISNFNKQQDELLSGMDKRTKEYKTRVQAYIDIKKRYDDAFKSESEVDERQRNRFSGAQSVVSSTDIEEITHEINVLTEAKRILEKQAEQLAAATKEEARASRENSDAKKEETSETDATKRSADASRDNAGASNAEANANNNAASASRNKADASNAEATAENNAAEASRNNANASNAEAAAENNAATSKKKRAKAAADQARAQKQQLTLETQMSGLLVKGRIYYDQYSKSISKNSDLSAKWNVTLDKLTKNQFGNVQEARKALNALLIESKDAGVETERISDKIRASFAHRIGFTLSAMTFSTVISSLRKVYTNVVQLDSAMTQLRIITQDTERAYEKFADRAAESATKIGRSMSEIVSSAETWARLGYSLDEAASLAEVTGVFANVAAVSEEEATTTLTSVLKAYNWNPDEALHIVDILTEVGQKYAISASELGVALQRGGAALAATGNTLEESVALMAAGNAAVQNAESVGTALKTMTLRITGSKAELEDMGEEVDELASSTSKMREEILGLSGVDIMLDEDTYKSTYQILREIAGEWENISGISQTALLEDLGGKRGASIIASIINNLKDLEGAYGDAIASDGVATKANETAMDSIAKKQERAKAQYEDLSRTVLDSGLIKAFYDAGYGVTWFLTQLMKLKSTIPVVSAIAIAVRGMKKEMASQAAVSGAVGAMSGMFNPSGLAGVIDPAQTLPSIKAYNNAIAQSAEALSLLTPKQREQALAMLQVDEATKAAITSQLQDNVANIAATPVKLAASAATVKQAMAQAGLTAAQADEVFTLSGVSTNTKVLTKARLEDIRATLLQKAADASLSKEQRLAFLNAAKSISTVGGVGKGVIATLTAGLKGLVAFLSTPTGIITAIVAVALVLYNVLKKVIKTQADYIEDAKKSVELLDETNSKLDENNKKYDELIKRKRILLALGDKASAEEVAELRIADQKLEQLERQNEILEREKRNQAELARVSLQKAYKWELRDPVVASEVLSEYYTDQANTAAQSIDIQTNGNIVYRNRPIISPQEMWDAGWDEFNNDFATTYTQGYNTANNIQFEISPILPDGTVLSPGELDEYVRDVLSKSTTTEELLANDDMGIVFQVHVGNDADGWDNDYWDNFNKDIRDAKEIHGEAVLHIAEAEVDKLPQFSDVLFGVDDINDIDEDDLQKSLQDANKELEEQEEIIAKLEDSGITYVKNATSEEDKQTNALIRNTRLKRDAWLIASGSVQGYTQLLKDLNEYEIVSIDDMRAFIENPTDPELIAKYTALFARFGVKIEDVSEIVNLFRGYLNDLDKKAEESAKKIQNILYGISAEKDIYEALKDPYDALAAAQKEMAESEYVNYETVLKLKELGLDKYLVQTADGYKLVTNALDDYTAATRQSVVDDLNAAKAKLEHAKAIAEVLKNSWGVLRAEAAMGNKEAANALRNPQNLKNAEAAVAELEAKLANLDRVSATLKREVGKSSSSSSSSEDAYLAQWEKVKTAMEHEIEMGKRTQASYIKWLEDTTSRTGYLGKHAEKYADQIRAAETEIHNFRVQLLEDGKDAIESLFDFREEQLKRDYENQKDALDKEIDNLEDFYDKQLEMLEDQYDEEDYLEEQSEKRKELSRMKAQMDMLSRDDSAWAKKRLAELEDEYAEADKEYQKWERDHARDTAKELLEDQKEASVKSIQDQIDAIEKIMDDDKAVRDQAIQDILSGNIDVYKSMLDLSKELGTMVNDNITGNWLKAAEAIDAYRTSAKSLVGVDWADNESVRFFLEYINSSTKFNTSGVHYASGTRSAHGGVATTQENGPEVIMRRIGGLFTLLSPGDKVFTSNATDFLYSFANNPSDILARSMASLLSRSAVSPVLATSAGAMNIDMGDVVINGNASDKTVSEFRRAKRELVNEMLQEFKKLR